MEILSPGQETYREIRLEFHFFFKLGYAAKRSSSILFSSVPFTIPHVGTIIHMVNQIVALVEVKI